MDSKKYFKLCLFKCSAFNNYLRGIDVSTIVTEPSDSATFNNDTLQWSDGSPLTTSIEKWCESQGQTAINFLELF